MSHSVIDWRYHFRPACLLHLIFELLQLTVCCCCQIDYISVHRLKFNFWFSSSFDCSNDVNLTQVNTRTTERLEFPYIIDVITKISEKYTVFKPERSVTINMAFLLPLKSLNEQHAEDFALYVQVRYVMYICLFVPVGMIFLCCTLSTIVTFFNLFYVILFVKHGNV